MAVSAIRLVLGVPIRFNCDGEQTYQAVCNIYPDGSEEAASKIQISIKFSQDDSLALDFPAVFNVDHHCFVARSGNNHFSANRITHRGTAILCERMLKNEYALRHQIFNALCYYLLSYQYFLPIHAASFILNDYLVLCFGKSGLGKSTLAMAAMQRKLPVLSEDLCFVSSNPKIGIRTDCREFHLYPDSYGRFSCERHFPLTTTHNGKLKHIVTNANRMDNLSQAKFSGRVLVLFLEKGHHQKRSQLDPASDTSYFEQLKEPEEAGFNLYSRARLPAINWLQSQTCFQGTIGSCFDDFFSQISDIVDQASCISQ